MSVPPSPPAVPGAPADASGSHFWADTNLATQLIDRSPPPGGRPQALDLGEPVGQHARELFVSCDVPQAMRMALDQTGLRYMVIADLGGGRAKRGFVEVARASGWPVQRLVVRRQGFGDILATLLFMDSPTLDGGSVRVFCADVDTEESSRAAVAHVLMARAELVALLVPDQDDEALGQTIQALARDVDQRDLIWTNRHLIFMPARTSPALVSHLGRFRTDTGIQARMAPAVSRADQIWVYLGSTWNQLQEQLPASQRLTLKTLALLVSVPVAQQAPVPDGAAAAVRSQLAHRLLQHLMQQSGVQRACLFSLQRGTIEACSGTQDDAQTLVEQGRALLKAVGRAGEELALGRTFVDASFTLAAHRVVVRGQSVLPGAVMLVVMARQAPPLGPLPSREQLLGG